MVREGGRLRVNTGGIQWSRFLWTLLNEPCGQSQVGAMTMIRRRRMFLSSVTFLAVLCVGVSSQAAASIAQPAAWSLSADYSANANPNGAWAFGSKSALGAPLELYTDTAAIDQQYHSNQLAGWT